MNFIDLRISGQDIDLDEVSKGLNIIPTYSYKQGEERIFKGEKVVYKEDCWIAQVVVEDEAQTEEKVEEWVDLFYKKKEFFQQLSDKHSVVIWITLYPETEQCHLHFPKSVIAKLSKLNVDMGITCMQLQDFYSGRYLSMTPRETPV